MTEPIALDPDILSPFASARAAATLHARPAEPTPLRSTRPTDDELLAPPDWDSYVGQARAKAELRIRIHSAGLRNTTLEPTLLHTGPGMGKTTLARLIAQELGREFRVITKPCTTDRLVDRLHDFYNGVLFVDEIHQWGKRANNGGQHALMQLIEDGTLDGPIGPVRFHLTVIAATTNPEHLFKPLRDRFTCTPTFDPYTLDQMAEIIAGMSGRAAVPLTAATMYALASAAGGNPRTARKMVHAARDLYLAQLPFDAPQVLAMLDIDPDGLGRVHRDYLTKLSRAPGGKAGLNAMATYLRLPSQEVAIAEDLLCDRGYIYLTPSGRIVSPSGRSRAEGLL